MTVPAEAITAAAQAVAEELFDIGMWAPADADVQFATAAVKAAAPLLRAEGAAAERARISDRIDATYGKAASSLLKADLLDGDPA